MLGFLAGALLGMLTLLVLALHSHRDRRADPPLAKLMYEMDREARRTTGYRAAGD